MTDRAKQAREVAERIRERYIPANPAAYREQIVQELATWIGQALTAEHKRVEALTQALQTLDEAAAKHMHIMGMAPDWKCEICEAREAARKLVEKK